VKVETDVVGAKISTKAVGSNERHDITMEYKYPEGSIAERAAQGACYLDDKGDVKISIQVHDQIKMGEVLTFNVSVQKKIASEIFPKANIQLVLESGDYASRSDTDTVKSVNGSVNVPADPNQSSALHLTVQPSEYINFLKSGFHFSIKAFVQIPETKQITVLTKEFTFIDPQITFEYLGNTRDLRVGTKGQVNVTITNPFNFDLSPVSLQVDGQGLTKTQTFKIGTLKANQVISQNVDIEVLEKHTRVLIATISIKDFAIVDHHEFVVVG